MIVRIIDYSARHPAVVLAVALAASIWGWQAMRRVPLDALPDLGDTQVIVYSRWDRSPDLVEDQITYPIVSALLGTPRVKSVRGISDFGSSFVYVVFEDGTDIYWARSRTLEYVSPVLSRLPPGVRTELGPDATGLGWVFQYALVDRTGVHTAADLRSFQDWSLRYHLRSVPGVADVASIGGDIRQYQVDVDPNRLRAHRLTIGRVVEVVRGGNNDAGGRVVEFGGTEYMVRGRGYARSIEDIENLVLSVDGEGTPVRIRDIGEVSRGPDFRRGATDLDGEGEVVSGIVIMRAGENALDVIDRVKARLRSVEAGLPEGVVVEPIYDRSVLVRNAVSGLSWTLVEIMITVALVIVLLLRHIPSAMIPVLTIPVAVLVSFIPFHMTGMTANIMSLGGIAIAVGALVDASIVVVEQSHRRLELWQEAGAVGDWRPAVVDAIKEVAAPSFFALLVMAVSFVPVLTLEAEEGRLFRPLAYTKSLCMIVAAIVAITLDPALRMLLTRVRRWDFGPSIVCRAANALLVGRIHPEGSHALSRWLRRMYLPVAAWSLERPRTVIAIACALFIATVPVAGRLGSEFMPPLEEGTILYMPSTMPGLSMTTARQLLQTTDRVLKTFPEVERVLGKAGRADTATDPAPVSMLETLVTLKPVTAWRTVPTWYSAWAPGWLTPLLRRVTSDRISQQELVRQFDEALQIPGVSNAWTMPVKARTTMQATGVRTALGLKISGANLATIDALGARVEAILDPIDGTRSVFSERSVSGFFLDVAWDRGELARYGLSIDEAQMVVQHAIGGENVTMTVEGRERYPVNVRYKPDFRSDPADLERLPVSFAGGDRQVLLGQLARITTVAGPSMIRNENGLLTGYVYIDLADRDVSGYVQEAGAALAARLELPSGYAVTWTGQFESMARARERLMQIVPLTLLLIVLLIYANTRSPGKTALILLAVPFSAIGAVWLLYLLGYNISVGVWVGLIALAGVDAGTGVFMLLYLDLACAAAAREGRLRTLAELREAILQGAVTRLRPKFMTAATMVLGLLPIMWSTGAGADVMKRIAAPLLGGIITSFLLELLVYPPLFEMWKVRAIDARHESSWHG
jgi:Cu(I)/Ag(I) efflux system membrane protein CusA/SilA